MSWQLEEGDRVVFWEYDEYRKCYPTGTIRWVDPTAGFFPYWVQWDDAWNGRITEGGFQSSCFRWDKMQKPKIRNRDFDFDQMESLKNTVAGQAAEIHALCRKIDKFEEDRKVFWRYLYGAVKVNGGHCKIAKELFDSLHNAPVGVDIEFNSLTQEYILTVNDDS